jgi:hypothetical protein
MSANFWQNVSLEPKRGFRFLLSVQGGSIGGSDGISQFLIKSVKKPSVGVGESSHNFLNHTFFYPGRFTWQEVTLVIVDTVDPTANASKQVMQLLEASGYQLPTPPSIAGDRKTMSKKESVGGLGTVKIKTLNAEGAVIEEWVLNNAWVKTADFGSLDYGTEDLLNVSLSLRYDNAYLNVKGQGNFPTGPGISP